MGYVQSLGEELVRSSDRPDLPYRFKAIDRKEVDAFAFLGGFIYVNRGLILLAKNGELTGWCVGPRDRPRYRAARGGASEKRSNCTLSAEMGRRGIQAKGELEPMLIRSV